MYGCFVCISVYEPYECLVMSDLLELKLHTVLSLSNSLMKLNSGLLEKQLVSIANYIYIYFFFFDIDSHWCGVHQVN